MTCWDTAQCSAENSYRLSLRLELKTRFKLITLFILKLLIMGILAIGINEILSEEELP